MRTRFPSAARLKARREFTAVQDHGRRVSSKYMTLLARPNGGVADRLGIIASRRLGGAVVRNRAKRRLRAIFRCQMDTTEQTGPALDLVAIARDALVDAPFATLETDFRSAVRRLRGMR